MAQAMGIGQIGEGNVIFKRKFRYTFEVVDICGKRKIPENFVKTASRPSITIDETEINFLNGKTWIPGKATWESITVVYYDVATDKAQHIYSWLASVFDFTKPKQLKMGSKASDYSGTGTLRLYDGCGTPLEQWQLKNLWPTSINFGDLDYGNSEECNIELTLRYSNVTYKPLCPNFTISPCCEGCGPTSNQGSNLPATGGPLAPGIPSNLA
jgi:hypothetical protein